MNTKGPELIKYPEPPQPTPPATPFPTPTPKPSYNPEVTKQPSPFIDSVGGIPIFDARELLSPELIGSDKIMTKKITLVKAADFDKVVSFDVPVPTKSINPQQYKGIKLFVTYPSYLGTIMLQGTKYYTVNENIAKAVGSSSGGLLVPMNQYGDMFSPKPYKPIGKEQLIVENNHGFLYFIMAFLSMAIIVAFVIRRQNSNY